MRVSIPPEMYLIEVSSGATKRDASGTGILHASETVSASQHVSAGGIGKELRSSDHRLVSGGTWTHTRAASRCWGVRGAAAL